MPCANPTAVKEEAEDIRRISLSPRLSVLRERGSKCIHTHARVRGCAIHITKRTACMFVVGVRDAGRPPSLGDRADSTVPIALALVLLCFAVTSRDFLSCPASSGRRHCSSLINGSAKRACVYVSGKGGVARGHRQVHEVERDRSTYQITHRGREKKCEAYVVRKEPQMKIPDGGGSSFALTPYSHRLPRLSLPTISAYVFLELSHNAVPRIYVCVCVCVYDALAHEDNTGEEKRDDTPRKH